MAEKDGEELRRAAPERRPAQAGASKQYLLLGFVALCVLLVVFIWVDNLNETPGGQGFTRATPIIVTLEADATIPAHEEHKNRKSDPTPAPTATDLPPAETLPVDATAGPTPTPTRDAGDIGLGPGGAAFSQAGRIQ